MPSSTSLLETEEEPEIPPLVQTFAGLGLDDHGMPSPAEQPCRTSPFGVLGTVLDLQPLPRGQTLQADNDGEEDSGEDAAEEKEPPNHTLLSQAHVSGLASVMLAGQESPEAALLYSEHAALLPYGEPGYDMEPPPLLHVRRKSVNTKECVGVPSSEHVAEIVGRQGCKIKALRAKTNTYIKTPVRGEQPVFVVSGRKEDVAMAKREILSAAEHFSQIRASRNKAGPLAGTAPGCLAAAPNLPGQTTIQVRVPYRVVGLVVGPKGATIKRIQQQTHTYIVTPSRDKEPVFEVTGMPENVDRAREEIEAHITLRTGSSVELSGDKNDFHYNGTDVSFEASIGGGWLHSLLSAGVQGGGASAQLTAGYRNDSSSSVGSSSSDSFYSGGGRMADFSPTSPFNSNNGNCSGGSFWFGESLLSLGSEDLAGMDSRSFDGLSMAPVVWNPLEQGIQLFDARHAPLRDSQPETPRLSPTFQETLEHPMAKLVQSSFSSEEHGFSGYRAAFSCSSDSTASSSPPDQPFSGLPSRQAALYSTPRE